MKIARSFGLYIYILGFIIEHFVKATLLAFSFVKVTTQNQNSVVSMPLM